MVISELRLYELLKNRIGEKEAEALVHVLEEKMENKFDQRKQELALKEDVSSLRILMKEDVSNLRTELLRTIYLTSIGQLLAIVASVVSLILVLKK